MKNNLHSLTVFSRVIFVLLLMNIQTGKVFSQSVLPVPDHIVIAVLENHAYTQIIGSVAAPNINALANDSYSALFTQFYAVEHPSQPNYLDLFSGCNQGVTNDDFPETNPFTADNLARQLIDSGMTFVTYSEDLPFVGYNGATYGHYVRKHNPAANWMGTGINQIPETTNQPLTAFPSTDFTLLPTVCLVVPNQIHNMHDGTDPSRIIVGDTWIYDNLNNYIEWAKTHNSLFILTFDEDDEQGSNRIVTIFTGQMVEAGQYAETYNLYNILRTIEDMYGLPHACNAATATAISGCWNTSNGIAENPDHDVFSVFPNPADGKFSVQLKNSALGKFGNIEVYNAFGKKVFMENFTNSDSKEIHLKNSPSGIYFVKVSNGEKLYIKKVVIE
jgi:Phosphoesterase family.